MSQVVSITVTENGGRIGSVSYEIDEEAAYKWEGNVPQSTTDQSLVGVTADVSELALVFIHSDAAVTLETNDGTTPVQTFTLAAGEFIVWAAGMPQTNPLTDDVTAIYATTGAIGAAGANLTIILVHAQP